MKPNKGWMVSMAVYSHNSIMPNGAADEVCHLFVVVPSSRVTNRLVDDLIRKQHRARFGWDPQVLEWQSLKDQEGAALSARVAGESGTTVHYVMTETEVYG